MYLLMRYILEWFLLKLYDIFRKNIKLSRKLAVLVHASYNETETSQIPRQEVLH